MRGVPSVCSICGVVGQKHGCPSWGDVCADAYACRERAVENERRKVEKLERRVKELESAGSR